MKTDHFNEIALSPKGLYPQLVDKSKNYFSSESGSDFPIRNYIVQIYDRFPVMFHSDDVFNDKLLDFLMETGSLISFTSNGKCEKAIGEPMGFRGGTFWFTYKNDNFIKITVKSQDDSDSHFWDEENINYTSKKYFNLSIIAPCGSKMTIDDFIPFIAEIEGSKIHLFIKDGYGECTLEPLKVKVPKNMDLALNYGEKFVPIYNMIHKRLEEKPNGLYMFHGPPGTGKSSLIKYLAGNVKRDFIYIPTTMLETFATDPASLKMLIEKNNSVFVLEDAERLVMQRHGDNQDSSAVSALLNLSDGILSDILNISIIITYNCQTDKIDKALLRKGRLQSNYKFDLLSVENAQKLCKYLEYPAKLTESIVEPTSLADIYNLETETTFYEEPEEPKVGF